jgi:hypothetical protein
LLRAPLEEESDVSIVQGTGLSCGMKERKGDFLRVKTGSLNLMKLLTKKPPNLTIFNLFPIN